jgi:FAD/FMN-containing dehydrogenase
MSSTDGRSLRDEIAARAMGAVINMNPTLPPEQLADYAYELADAMLEARMRLPMQRQAWPVLNSNTDFAKLSKD